MFYGVFGSVLPEEVKVLVHMLMVWGRQES